MNNNIFVNLKFTADTSQARTQMKTLQNQLSEVMNLSTNSIGSNMSEVLVQDLKAGQQAAASLKVSLQSAFNVNTGKLNLNKFNKSLQESGMSLQSYKTTLLSLGPAGRQAFTQLSQAVAMAETPLFNISQGFQRLGTTFMNTFRYQISASVLSGVTSAISKAYNYAQDLNKSLNNIRIVTGYSADRMSDFAKEANKAAKALSTTTTAYTDASLIYFQQGLEDEQVKKRTDTTIKLANVTGQDVQIVSDQLTAIWNNFDDGSKELEYYADVITKLGAATASSTDEISDGLEKFAAVSETVGLSYEMATAALATVTSETRQSADVVGTAFKTIFSRMEGLKLGETLDDGTTLNQYSSALATAGVNIKDQNDQLKEMDDILNELGAKWGTLNKDTQIALAQSVAGVRQYNQFIALMGNWDKVQENLDIAVNSTGELNKQADIYADSWEAARNRVSASLETIYNQILKDDFFIDLTNFFSDFIDVISNVIDSLGGLQGVLLLLGSVLTKVFSQQIINGLSNIKHFVLTVTGVSQKKMAETKAEYAEGISENYKKQSGTLVGGIQSKAAQNMVEASNLNNTSAENLTSLEKETLELLTQQVKQKADLAIQSGEVVKQAKAQVAELEKIERISKSTKQTIYSPGDETGEDKEALDLIAETAEKRRVKYEETYADGRSKKGPREINFETNQGANGVKNEILQQANMLQTQASTANYLGNQYVQQLSPDIQLDAKDINSSIQGESSQLINTANIEQAQKQIDSVIQKVNLLQETLGEKKVEVIGPEAAKRLDNYSGSLKKVQVAVQNLQATQKSLQGIQKKMSALETSGKKDSAEYIKLQEQQTEQLSLLEKQTTEYNDSLNNVTKDQVQYEETVDGMSHAADVAYSAAGKMGANIEEASSQAKTAGEEMGKFAHATIDSSIALQAEEEALDKATSKPAKLSESMVGLSQTIMTVGMAFSSFKGLFDTWNNEDLSAGDKLIATFTTLGMVIPMVTSAFNKQNLAQLSTISSMIASIFGIEAHTLAIGADGVITNTATGATIGFGTALYTVLWPIGLVMAAILALVGIVMLLVNAFKNAQANSPEGQLKALSEQSDALNENLNTTKERVDSIREAFDTWKSAEDKLNSLTKGTAEWNTALLESNMAMQDLLTLMPQLRTATNESGESFLYTDENGALRLREGAEEYIANETNNQLIKAQKAANYAETAYLDKKATIERDEKVDQTASEYMKNSLGLLGDEDAAIAIGSAGLLSGHILSGTIGGLALDALQEGVSDVYANDIQDLLDANDEIREGNVFETSNQEDMDKLEQLLSESAILSSQAYDDDGNISQEFVDALNKNVEAQNEYKQALLENTKQLIANNQAMAASVLSENEIYKNEKNESKKLAMQNVLAAEQARIDRENINTITETQTSNDIGTLEGLTKEDLINLLGETQRSKIEKLDSGGDNIFDDGGVSGLAGTDLANFIFTQYKEMKEAQGVWKEGAVVDDFYEDSEAGEKAEINVTLVGEEGTTDLDVSLVTMLTELAANKALETMKSTGEEVAKRISQWSETQAKIALGQIDTLTEAEMSQYFTESGVGEDGFKQYTFDNTKLSDQDISDMAAAAGYIDEEGLILVEEFEKHLADQVEKYNAGTAAAKRYVNAVSEMNAEMDAQAESLGTTADALKDYTKYLFESRKANIDWSEDMGEAYRQAAKYTLALAEMNQGFKELDEALDNNLEELKQWNEEGDYSLRAMEKAAEAAEGLSKILGVDVDGGFVLDNINLIEELMQGSTTAAEQLQNQLQEFYTNSLNITNQARDELNNSLNNIKAGVNTEDAIQKLNELMRNGELTQEQVEDSLASIGYTPDIRTVPVTTSSTTTSTITEIGADGKPTGKVLKQVSVNENQTEIPYIATSETHSGIEIDAGTDENGKKVTEKITYETGSGLTKNNIDLTTAATSWKKDQENEEKASNKEDAEDLEIEGYEDQRYIKRNNNIEKINNSLAKQERLTNKLSGSKKLDSMQKEVKILKKLSEEQGKLTAETRGYLELDRTNLIDKIGKKAKFDKDGQLLNEEELKRYYQGIVIEAQKAYKASATNANKEALEEAEKERDEIFALIDTYQETYKKAADDEMAYLESQDAVIEASTNTFLEALDQKAEAVDRFNDKIDRTLKLLEIKLKDLEDIDYSGAQAAVLIEQSIVTSMEKAIKDQQTYLDAQADYESIKDGYDENGDPVSQEAIDAAFDRMLEAGDDMLDSAQTLKEYEDQLDELLISHLDEQEENFAEVSDELEHYSGVLEHYNNILDLTGAKVQSNDVLLEIADAQVQNAKTQLQTSKAKFDTLSKELAQAQAAGASEKVIQDLTQRVREAQQEMLSDLADGLQAAADKYATTIEVAAKEAEKALLKNSKYNSLEDAQQAFDQQQELNDLYVEEYDKLYQLNKLTRDINKSMANSDSLLANRELSALLDEINEKRKSGVEMSQYELDVLQRKYDLRLAEIALEEAQDAKDSMRLTRDTQGNWTYTYTADQNKVQEAEQQYEDALYSMQQSNEEYLDQLQSNIMQTQSEMIEAIKSLRVEDFASYEEYEQAVEQIRQFYLEKNRFYYDEINKTLDSHNSEMERSVNVYTRSMNNSLNTIGDAYGRQLLTFKDLVLAEVTGVTTVDEAVNGFTDSVNGYLEAAKTAFDDYKKAQEGVLSIVELNFSTTAGFINSDLNDINTNTETLGKNLDSLKSKAEAGFDGVLKAVQKIKAQYATEMDELIGKAQTLYEYLTKKYNLPEVPNPPKDEDPGITKTNDSTKKQQEEDTKNKSNGSQNGDKDKGKSDKDKDESDKGSTNDKTYKVKQVGTHDDGYAAVKLDNGKWYDARAVLNGAGDIGDIVYDRIIKERNIKPIEEKRIDDYTLSIPPVKSDISITRYTPAGKKVSGVLPLDITSGAGPFEITGAKQGENGWIYRMKYVGKYNVDQALKTLYINNNDLNKLRGTSGISYGDQHKFAKYDTGGYTGEWGPEGKWAMLHEKELILNKDQTSDFLNSLEVMSHIVDVIDRNSMLAAAGLAIDKASAAAITERVIQQTVSIEANFPGVTSAIEIEDALNNIINDAAQYAAIRK